MFLGWYDPDKKTPARYKLEDALERYSRKFGHPAATCITSPEDAAELESDKEAPELPVRGVGFIPRYTFYVGFEDVAEDAMRPAPTPAPVPSADERKPDRRRVPAVDSSDRPAKPATAKPRRRTATKATPVAETTATAKPPAEVTKAKPKAKRAKPRRG